MQTLSEAKIAKQFEESLWAVEWNGVAQADAVLDAGDPKASAQAQGAGEPYAEYSSTSGLHLSYSGKGDIDEIEDDFFPNTPISSAGEPKQPNKGRERSFQSV